MADMMNTPGRLSLVHQVPHSARFRDEKKIGDRIRYDSIEFLRHGHIATAQAGLDMGNGYAELIGDDRAGQSRVDVPDYEDAVRSPLLAGFLEADHDLRGLLRVRAATRPQEDVGRRNVELVEEHLVQFVVVMLAGMDDFEAQVRAVRA